MRAWPRALPWNGCWQRWRAREVPRLGRALAHPGLRPVHVAPGSDGHAPFLLPNFIGEIMSNPTTTVRAASRRQVVDHRAVPEQRDSSTLRIHALPVKNLERRDGGLLPAAARRSGVKVRRRLQTDLSQSRSGLGLPLPLKLATRASGALPATLVSEPVARPRSSSGLQRSCPRTKCDTLQAITPR